LCGVNVSYRTVQRAAHNRGLRPFRRPVASRLTAAHKKGRFQFAKVNKNKDWSAVIFSDEHRFKQFKGGNPQHDQVWGKSSEEVPVKEVERWGLAVDVWAGISSRGKTNLYICDGTFNAQEYQHCLQTTLMPAVREWFSGDDASWVLQQDKATAHTAQSTTAFLEQEGIPQLEGWPTKGDDINPMENLWAILDERLEGKKFHTKKSMIVAVREIWKTIDNQLIHNLIDSIPGRLLRILNAKGGSVKSVH